MTDTVEDPASMTDDHDSTKTKTGLEIRSELDGGNHPTARAGEDSRGVGLHNPVEVANGQSIPAGRLTPAEPTRGQGTPNRRKMRCVLHVGTEKTGTTTIQEFMHVNRKFLSQLGYLYTKTAGLQANRKLPLAAYDAGRRDDFTNDLGLYTNEDLKKYQTKIVRDLSKEIDRAGAHELTVFSSEHLQSRLTTPEELSRLKSLLNQIGYEEIQILIYLRRPVDLATSLYSTFIKVGSTDTSPRSPEDEYYRNICDHRNTLKRFIDVFGETAVVPRIFGKDEFKNGSIISDYLTSIGLVHAEGSFVIPANQNERLSAVALEILRRVNKRVPMFINERPNRLRADVEAYFSGFNGGHVYTMPENLFRRYEMEFEEGNEWVREKYFPERNRLFPKAIHPGIVEVGFNQNELEGIANMIADMWLDNQKRFVELSNQKTYRLARAIGRLRRLVTAIWPLSVR